MTKLKDKGSSKLTIPTIFGVVVVVIISLISPATSESITEYREVVFYPNGTQSILKDWLVVVFDSEPLRYSIKIMYRNTTLETPIGEGNLTLSGNLLSEEFNLSIMAKQDGNRIVYTVENKYPYEMKVNISIPVFDAFSDCEKCEVDGDRINLNLTIPPQSSENFTIYVSSPFTIPDSDVSFRINSQADVTYELPIDFTIYKHEMDNRWLVTFEIKNENDREVNVTLIGWANINNTRIDLLNHSTSMKPKERLEFHREVVSSDVPVFYLKVSGKVNETREVSIVPVKQVEGRYIVGSGILKGFSGVVTYAPPATVETPSPEATPTSSPTYTPEYTPTPTPYITPLPTKPTPTPIPAIKPPKVPEVVKKVAPVVMLPATYILMFSLLVTPIVSLRGVVVDRESLTPENFAMIKTIGKKIYISPSTPLRGCHVVNADRTLVDNLRTTYNLSLPEAEAIAIALTLRRPIFTGNRRLFESALRAGCIAYLIKSE